MVLVEQIRYVHLISKSKHGVDELETGKTRPTQTVVSPKRERKKRQVDSDVYVAIAYVRNSSLFESVKPRISGGKSPVKLFNSVNVSPASISG